MKERIYYINITLAVILTFFVCSCEFETSGNGKLDGMWHLMTVDTLSKSVTEDVSSKRIYWSFQHNLVQFDDKANGNSSILLRFDSSTGSTLRLYNSYIYDRENGDKPVEDINILTPFGMNAFDETYIIERLTGSILILSTDELRLYFKKN